MIPCLSQTRTHQYRALETLESASLDRKWGAEIGLQQGGKRGSSEMNYLDTLQFSTEVAIYYCWLGVEDMFLFNISHEMSPGDREKAHKVTTSWAELYGNILKTNSRRINPQIFELEIRNMGYPSPGHLNAYYPVGWNSRLSDLLQFLSCALIWVSRGTGRYRSSVQSPFNLTWRRRTRERNDKTMQGFKAVGAETGRNVIPPYRRAFLRLAWLSSVVSVMPRSARCKPDAMNYTADDEPQSQDLQGPDVARNPDIVHSDTFVPCS
ncbi:hypothetical protein LshimejAT787_1801430 [Lyophyllum shimeji]|uniref:Uncharacterized protein n=1 Tax=Lyophyllum shimeji TaxID=47721 RepID=A0A9P3Q155_LYOSH|nr:hypothetical protein LshimejAT787_1801430 [Lyophyllum shimeji]